MPAGMVWFRDNPGIMSPVGHHKCQFVVSEEVKLVDGTPWRDVISFCANSKCRNPDVLESDYFPVYRITARCQAILQK